MVLRRPQGQRHPGLRGPASGTFAPSWGSRSGSIFLMAMTIMVVIFILAFSLSYFTGSEDWASAVSYESEVAFCLAESAVEEFVARLKNSLNHNDSDNQLYKALRGYDTPVDKDIPLDAAQVARLTGYTRETARQIYGIQFGQGMSNSKEFSVEANIKLQHLNPIEAKEGEKVLYKHVQDPHEKQGELAVTARVTYRGRTAKIQLSFLLRVVKTFVPPFNYFTLFVRDGSVVGGSSFNCWGSNVGEQQKNVRLDNGWTSIPGHENFNAVTDVGFWEKALNELGNKAYVPPGRVFLGQDPSLNFPAVILQSTNGTKLLTDHASDGAGKVSQINGQENFFLKFDLPDGNAGGMGLPWLPMKDYVKKFMADQGQEKTKEGWIFTGYKDCNIRVRNVGSGFELIDSKFSLGEPTFVNALQSFNTLRNYRVKQAFGKSENEGKMLDRLFPSVGSSGLDLFGAAPCLPPLAPRGGSIKAEYLSPTIVYGPVWRMYYRVTSVELPNGAKLELPFIGTAQGSDGSPPVVPIPDRKKELNATEAGDVFTLSGVPKDHVDKLIANWDADGGMPKGLKVVDKYENFMSNSGMEPYNAGLGNFIQRLKDEKKIYSGDLEKLTSSGYAPNRQPFMANEQYPGMDSGLAPYVRGSPVNEFFQGDLFEALPSPELAYLMDFYFIPRSTEDFFRGRTTISMGGQAYDRFDFKYINDVRSYLSGAKNQTLELNGILALNDSEPLVLNNLNFRGKGIIYSSPMMGGGKVIIAGDFYPAAAMSGTTAAFGSNPDRDMITIVAPQICIDTSTAQTDPCYVEANLISVFDPIIVKGTHNVKIKGSVVCPRLNVEESFLTPNGADIIYNPLNSIWRKDQTAIMEEMYITKIVTGGVGKFDWKYTPESME